MIFLETMESPRRGFDRIQGERGAGSEIRTHTPGVRTPGPCPKAPASLEEPQGSPSLGFPISGRSEHHVSKRALLLWLRRETLVVVPFAVVNQSAILLQAGQ